MHNGQIGGSESVRKTADMLIPDQLYLHRRGATDSEAFFLVVLGDGLDGDPIGAVTRTIQIIEALDTKSPKFSMTAALSDAKRLFAVRYAPDGRARSLYHRWSAQQGGRSMVSEPFGAAGSVGKRCSTLFFHFDGQDVDMTPL